MNCKLMMTIIVSIAAVIALLSLIPNQYANAVVGYTFHFFLVMTPVLAVGGLLKWIFFCDK